MLEMAKVLRYYGFAPDIMETSTKIICPFHEDVRPSMKVDVSGNYFHCFGCGKSGNAQRFAVDVEKKYHNLNDIQAYQKYLKMVYSLVYLLYYFL